MRNIFKREQKEDLTYEVVRLVPEAIWADASVSNKDEISSRKLDITGFLINNPDFLEKLFETDEFKEAFNREFWKRQNIDPESYHIRNIKKVIRWDLHER